MGVIERKLSKLEIKEETEGGANQAGKEEDKKGEGGSEVEACWGRKE